MAANTLSYEQALQELEQIVSKMQQQTVSIDDLETQSKRAAELVNYCRTKLRNIEEGLGNVFQED